jgi:hypothetical protein
LNIAEATRLKQEAARRVLARRRPDRGWHDPEFMPPRDIGEWCDDGVASLPAVAPYVTLIEILDAARQGEEAARAVMCSAAALTAQEQFNLFATLAGLAAGPAEAQQAVAAIQAEWRRLGLRTARPEPQPAAKAGAR